ncbi:hypothetical protein [Dietzia timorensis]|uniref:Trehalose-2-sulfate acyltransferase papA2 n=1 Tax=Dietzia timorensis TaxID=499555 RepID=A0A173LMT1_9ACTN|nr:hypothetical protein [Dietzia timorensis]ANI93586.1 Trehalose-2-sulfate acyltransferase papA2 [Dietzia timorensis]
MRLTTIARMDLAAGTVHRYSVQVRPIPGTEVPVSFDQERHVALGSRPGSWIAAAFRPTIPARRDELARAWHAVIARHGTLTTVFSPALDTSAHDGGRPTLTTVEVHPGAWVTPQAGPGEDPRAVLRREFDRECDPFAAPSYALCLVEHDHCAAGADRPGDSRPTVVIGFDHAHVDAWSLLVVARDFAACLADVARGAACPGSELPPAPAFARHTAELAAQRVAPESVRRRWEEIMAAGGGEMPVFPLPLGDISVPRDEVVEVHHVLDAAGVERLAAHARSAGTRMLALAVAEMTLALHERGAAGLRAVFPVHSRTGDTWHDSVGWFITNSVLECISDDPLECGRRITEAIALGNHPLEPILRPWGGMPHTPGMFALSWLDHRRLPVDIDPALEPQHVSARIRTTGVMVWFVVNDTGLHMRCRYPDTPQARAGVGGWLRAVGAGLDRRADALLEASPKLHPELHE